MGLKLGAHIAELRKGKGMTQEQLASAVGVSPPAVSKWETNASCPDIALLCPLARALDTNVDTLLQFEESLPGEQLILDINEIVEAAQSQGYLIAETMLQKLLHTYPTSIPLKYNASGVFTMFEMMFLAEDNSEKKEEWQKQKKQLLEEIRASGASAYWQYAVSELASIAIRDEKLELAEQLLKELPEHTADPTLIWAQLYLKRQETEKALEVTQKRLYVLVRQVQNCLMQMMNKQMEPDGEKVLEICEIYRKTEEIFGLGKGMSEGLFAEIYQRAGLLEKSLDSLLLFIDTMTGTVQTPKPLLFSAAVKMDGEHQAASKEMRKMILQGLLTEDSYAPFHQEERFQRAVKKLRDSIEMGDR